jgi:hypothetical protein
MTVYVSGFGGEFGTIDLSNPSNITYHSIGNTGLRTAGMGFTSNGNLYLLDLHLNLSNSDLWQINPLTAGKTNLGGVGQTGLGATIGPDGKTMYAIDQNVPAGLYTLAPPSTTSSPIGNTGLNPDGLMAFGPGGTLYSDSFSQSGDALVSLNLNTGASTPIGSGFGPGIYIATGTFLNGTFYGFGGNLNDNSLGVYTIDTSTGVATLYGSYSLGSGDQDPILGVAVAPAAVPEPSTLAIGIVAMILGSTAAVWKTRRGPAQTS